MSEEKENNKEEHRIKREAKRSRGTSTGSSSRSLRISGHSRSSSGRGSRRRTRPTTKSSSSRSLHTSGHSRSPSKHGLRRGIRSSEDLRAKDRARRSRPAKAKPGARAARDRDSLSPHRQRSRQRSPRANRSDDNLRAGLSSSRHGSHRSLRSEEDRLAKRQARAAGSDAAKPGAHTASNADESSLARRKNRADRPPKTNRSGEDRLAKDRARSARSHTSNPGAHTSSNGDESRSARRKIRANRDRDAKVRTKNGATKSSGNGVGSDGVVDEVERDVVVDGQSVGGSGDVALKAMAIEDLENEQLKEQQAQIEALKQQMQNIAQPNHGSDPDTEDDTDIDGTNEPHGQHPKKRRKCIVGILLVLLTIGGGVAGYILGTSEKSPTKALQLDVEPTTPPTTAGGNTTAIQLPSTAPSNSPTELQIYTPPSKEDCEAIASGSTLSDQTTLTSREFVIEFDATLNSQMAEEDWVGPLKEQLQSIFLPVVAGCSTRRWLRETKSKQHRQLQLLPDFAIANGKIRDAIVTEGGCEDESAAALCHRVSVLMDLSLRDEDTKLTFVEAYLITTLRASPDNVLGLGTLLSNLVVVRAAPTSPTDEPSISPSFTPSTVQPTAQPTDVPSPKPSFAPVVGPTTLEPTKSPTKAPTKAPVAAPILSTENPTASPTKAPVVVPTLAPVVGPTPPPTQAPTKGPSAAPSSAPSAAPSVAPSKVPTKRPTANPTSTPTRSPTASPTSGPTSSPSKAPTKAPTQSPTSGPTSSPTSFDVRPILMDMYDGLNTQFASSSNGWEGTGDECLWSGVGCDSSGNVVSITLENKGLDGTISSRIGELSTLTNLVLATNSLVGTIPTEIGLCTKLRFLTVRENPNLGGSIPTEIGLLTALELVNFYDDNLTGNIPTEIAGMKELRMLILAINNLSGTVPSEIGLLTGITHLDIAVPYGTNPALSGPLPIELYRLTGLQSLIFYGNSLSGSLATEVGRLTDLAYFNLGHTHLGSTIPSEIGNLAAVEMINFERNNFIGSLPSEIGNLSALKLLWLYAMDGPLTGKIPSEIINLTALTDLRLSSNQLTGNVPQLKASGAFEVCDLRNNALGDKSVGVQAGCWV